MKFTLLASCNGSISLQPTLRPVGTLENSPAVHCWVRKHLMNKLVPEGRLKERDEYLSMLRIHPSLRDSSGIEILVFPAMNRWAIFNLSLRGNDLRRHSQILQLEKCAKSSDRDRYDNLNFQPTVNPWRRRTFCSLRPS